MSTSTQSIALNSTQSTTATAGTGDAAGELEATIGGAVVQEYDQQIRLFTADLVAIDGQKKELRADKLAITALGGTPTTMTEESGYTVINGETTGEVFTGKAQTMTASEYNEFLKLAQEYGVEVTGVGSKGTKYAVPESIIETIKGEIDNRITDLNSMSEIKLINYQALMDGRKQSLMMLSNLISSDNQTRMAVIQNFKS